MCFLERWRGRKHASSCVTALFSDGDGGIIMIIPMMMSINSKLGI